MGEYDLEEMIDYSIREQINKELSMLSKEERDNFYDVKDRYQELYARYYEDYIEEHSLELDQAYNEEIAQMYEDNMEEETDELVSQKYARELCRDDVSQQKFDENLEDELENIYLEHSNTNIEDPNKW